MEQNNQTISPPRFTGAALWALLLPLVLEQILNVTMGMADTLMVSSVGEAAVSSVSLVDSVNTLIIQILSALATGGAVVASQYLGRKDYRSARRGAAQLYSVLVLCTVTAAALVLVFRYIILRTVFGAIDSEVMAFAETYFFVSALSYPFMGLYNAGAALFRAQGNSRVSMLASLVMNGINIAGNALLIYGFGMGVLGAAIATLVGRIFAAAWVTLQLEREENPLRIGSFSDLRPDMAYWKRILAIGVPSGLENGMFQIGKLLVSHLTSTLGTVAIAANAVANSLSGISNVPGNAVGLAMIPVVGQCLGGGDKAEARRYAKKLLLISYIGIWMTNIGLFIGIPYLAQMFNLSAPAVASTIQVVRAFNLVSVFLWPASFTLPNALRAGGDARFTMAASMFSMWVFRVLLTYFFVLRCGMGLMGVWVGMFVDWGCRVLLFAFRFAGNKWMEHKVI